jgi:hypothetical protein
MRDALRSRLARSAGHGDALKLEGVRAVGEAYRSRKLKAFWWLACRFERCSFDGMQIEYACFSSGKQRSDYIG